MLSFLSWSELFALSETGFRHPRFSLPFLQSISHPSPLDPDYQFCPADGTFCYKGVSIYTRVVTCATVRLEGHPYYLVACDDGSTAFGARNLLISKLTSVGKIREVASSPRGFLVRMDDRTLIFAPRLAREGADFQPAQRYSDRDYNVNWWFYPSTTSRTEVSRIYSLQGEESFCLEYLNGRIETCRLAYPIAETLTATVHYTSI